ncbi:MAG: nucleoside phosphorylase [Flavobacteriales bacterium]|jgi:uridine phosphorylase|nr:nucleoside phosphorylase [Flavobacteriales bacterium]
MNKLRDTELIITKDGRIYHLNLKKNEIANNIILVGDPERVSQISKKFQIIEYKIQHREFITHTGMYNKKRISVISSGIGTDNIDIVINEIDALVNIDFETRKINSTKKSLNIIRLGTSGSLNKDILVDSIIVSSYAIGFDGLAHFYKKKEIREKALEEIFIENTNWSNNHARPYAVRASDNLLEKFQNFNQGITLTATGFYGPQARELRLESSIKNIHFCIEKINYKKSKITNLEMETSALYFLGKSLGHNTLTICAVLGNRLTQNYSKDPKKIIDTLIIKVLNTL